MGLSKHIIPASKRKRLVDYAKERLPEAVTKQLANAETVAGFLAMVIARQNYGNILGLVGVAASRIADDIDGDTARAFDAAGGIGKHLDAILNDKLGAGVILPKMREANRGRPHRRAAIGIVAAKHTIISTINIRNFVNGTERDTTRAGAINMFVDSATMGAIAVGDTFKNERLQRAVDYAVIGSSLVGLATGAAAIVSYARPEQPVAVQIAD